MKAARVLFRVPRRAAHPESAAAPAADGTSCGESGVATKPFGQMPRVPSFPLVGSSWIYWPLVGKHHPDRRHEAALDMHRQYGPIVAEKLPGRYSLVHLFSADDFQALYQHEGKTPFRMGVTAFKKYRSSRPEFYKNIGILNMQGQEWYNLRSKTQPHTLRLRTLMSYLPGLDKIAEDTLRVLAQDRDAKGETPDCYALLYRWAQESVMFASLDTRIGFLSVPLDPLSDGAMILRDMNDAFACLQIFGYRFPYFRYFRTPSWKRFERAIDDFSVRLFRHIEAAAERLKTRTEDREYTILEYLLAEKKLEFGEILAFMSDFVLGGADTTSSTVTFCLYHLARNPEAQDRARQEVFDVVGNESPTLVPKHLNQLPFLKACVKESLRLNPILSGVFRKLDHDVTLSGYLVPAGTPLFTENYVASRLEENFTLADEFLPERWLRRDDQGHQDWALHPFASLPFSFGARMCLGRRLAELEIWIVLVKLLLKYRIEYHYEDIGIRSKLVNAPDKPARYRFLDLH